MRKTLSSSSKGRLNFLVISRKRKDWTRTGMLIAPISVIWRAFRQEARNTFLKQRLEAS